MNEFKVYLKIGLTVLAIIIGCSLVYYGYTLGKTIVRQEYKIGQMESYLLCAVKTKEDNQCVTLNNTIDVIIGENKYQTEEINKLKEVP